MDKTRARQMIADFASEFCGSHYLWGAGGSTPGNCDGVFYRPAAVTLHPAQTDPDDPKIFAATCNADGKSVCAGRFNKIPGGRLVDPGHRQDLVAYLKSLEGQNQNQWQPYYQWFSPRMVEGKKLKKQVVWGEDCRARRHFDCISFVNFVLSKTTTRQWSMSIAQYNAQMQEVDRSAPPVAGDILTRGYDHIAFLDSDGQVIQAEDSANGVHGDTKYSAAGWSRRGRLADLFLR